MRTALADSARIRPETAVNRRPAIGRLGWVLLVAPLALALASAGCFLTPGSTAAPRSGRRPSPGPPRTSRDCQACHAAPVAAHYAQSLHTAKGIRCGQCHTPGGHPNFTQPVRDGKCGGCHQPQYQETLASKHFADARLQLALDGDRAARETLRREGFTVATSRADGTSWVTRPRASSAAACARPVTTTSIASASPSCSGRTSASAVTRARDSTSPSPPPDWRTAACSATCGWARP